MAYKKDEKDKIRFSETINKKASRHVKAKRIRNGGIMFGMGVFGLVGWTVAIYTILGVLLGKWIDSRWPSNYSWTLTLLIIGLVFGIFNAWHWVKKEIEPPDDEDNQE